ncbi:VOC family protein [Cupriavidus agavae]|uniref:Glyoxalase-like protein n=1 Tax=Cupriavidus agavae TaxID=1001822 RepID=A0A4Q7S416_9BURK|nr:VOC family protein [Cupriavidus agavae]RZT41214.1 glyoxalase-like protein [Cupriavidus agavae]
MSGAALQVSEPFDHAVIVCNDLDAAVARWQALGFTLTPRGFHTLGSQNHCIMLARDYLELLHVTAPSPSRQYYWDAQQRGDGCAAMSCKSRDAFATADRLRAAGFQPSDPIEFSRPVRLDDGSEHPATFRVTALDNAPGARYFVCEHRTPELLWRPEWTAHANGATAIAATYLVVEAGEVARTANAYATLTGGAMTHVSGEMAMLDIAGASFVVTAPQALADAADVPGLHATAGYAAIRLMTDDLERARTHWRANGVRPEDVSATVSVIPGEHANGVTLVFEQR